MREGGGGGANARFESGMDLLTTCPPADDASATAAAVAAATTSETAAALQLRRAVVDKSAKKLHLIHSPVDDPRCIRRDRRPLFIRLSAERDPELRLVTAADAAAAAAAVVRPSVTLVRLATAAAAAADHLSRLAKTTGGWL